MADFIKLAAARKRMCKAVYGEAGATCEGCPLREYHNGTPAECNDFILDSPEKSQSLILKWAEEHPLPIYPTWTEWISATFPKTAFCLFPCSFISRKELCSSNTHYADDCDRNCVDCFEKHIPDHFAKKLHIKPINLKED